MGSIRSVSLILIATLQAGCYTLQPARVSPEVGTRVAFDVSDEGRVALGGSVGPEIDQIEGHLVDTDNGDYVLAVTAIRFIRGGQQTWTGERVSIKEAYVARAYERRFSKARTIAFTTSLLGAAAMVVLGSDLVGFGREDQPRPPRDPNPTELIGRRP